VRDSKDETWTLLSYKTGKNRTEAIQIAFYCSRKGGTGREIRTDNDMYTK